jgi:hypothetical protein
MSITTGGLVGIGLASGTLASTRLHVLSTSTQMRLAYDGAYYVSHEVSSGGNLTLTSVGTLGTFKWSTAVDTYIHCNRTVGIATSGFRSTHTGADWFAGINYSGVASSGGYEIYDIANSAPRISITPTGATTIHQWQNTGTTTLATAQGDAAFGVTREWWFDESSGTQYIRGVAGGAQIYLQNTATGTGATDGFLLQSDSVGDAYVWQLESRTLYFGTANTSRANIASNGAFTITQWLNVGASAQAVAANDFAAGSTSTNCVLWDDSGPQLVVGSGTAWGGATLLMRSDAPVLAWYQTDVGVDQKGWELTVNGVLFTGRAVNDAYSNAENWLEVSRSGITITSVVFPNGAVTITDWLNIGPVTDATAQGDFAAGLTGANRIFWDQSTGVWLHTGAPNSILEVQIINTANTASAGARLFMTVGGSSASDSTVYYEVTGLQSWTHGIDNSVAGDPFDISQGGTLGGLASRITIYADTETVFNEGGTIYSTRFEGDTLPYHFWLDSTATTENAAFFATAAPGWNGLDRGFFIGDSSAVPTGNPTAGGYMYSEAGAGKWRGSGGTITTFGPAEPHCPVCKKDFMHEWENDKLGYLAVCMNCLTEEIGERPWILRKKAA